LWRRWWALEPVRAICARGCDVELLTRGAALSQRRASPCVPHFMRGWQSGDVLLGSSPARARALARDVAARDAAVRPARWGLRVACNCRSSSNGESPLHPGEPTAVWLKPQLSTRYVDHEDCLGPFGGRSSLHCRRERPAPLCPGHVVSSCAARRTHARHAQCRRNLM
jgi:hypothetical protein